MRMRLLRVAGVCALLATMGSVQAAGNIEAGKKKAASCNTCHGEDGVGINPTPPLAGLTEEYFTRQMNAYKTGKRENAMMEAFARPLSDKDLADMAAYYAALPKPCGDGGAPAPATTDAGDVIGDIEAGKRKAAKGGASSCNGCHGLHGRGDPLNPRIAGLAPGYFIHEMNDYKTGAREHLMMQVVVQDLNEKDMADLAAYFASLR